MRSPQTSIPEAYERTRSIKATADATGWSTGTVNRVLRRLGVPRRPSGGPEKLPGIPPKWSRRIASNGYVTWQGWIPKVHRRQGGNRYTTLLEHRLVMEKALGRQLLTREQVHHKNGLRADNRLENLELRLGMHGSGASHCPHCGGVL